MSNLLRLPASDECFLCGGSLIGKGSDEHVFPQWLLHSVDLWNERIGLANATTIPYRQLKIPCCISCNGGPLSRLEETIKQAFDDGITSVRALDGDVFFKWFCKILYGVLYKQSSLPASRKEPTEQTIVPRQWLAFQRALRLMIHSIRVPAAFLPCKPYSLFLYEVHQVTEQSQLQYNYWFQYQLVLGASNESSHAEFTVSMIHNGVGVLFVPLDNEAHQRFGDYWVIACQEYPIHRFQFFELMSRLCYREVLRKNANNYSYTEADGILTIIAELPTRDAFEDWHNDDYKVILKRNLDSGHVNLAEVDWEGRGVITTLFDEERKPFKIDPNGNRIG